MQLIRISVVVANLGNLATTWNFFLQNELEKILGFLKQILKILIQSWNFLAEMLDETT